MRGLLERLALHRPELRAWAAYDWANSAAVTCIVVAIFPIYFADVACAGLPKALATGRLAAANALGLAIAAASAPLLGAFADRTGRKKVLLAAFAVLGAGAVAAMASLGYGDWRRGMLLYVLCLVGLNGSFVFYDALLPHVARADEVDRASAAGYALGYLGGGLLLAFDLVLIQRPGWFGLPAGEGASGTLGLLPARLSFLSVAAWWVLFSIPLLLGVKEPPGSRAWDPSPAGRGVVRGVSRTLAETARALRDYPQALRMLLAYLVYNDGIGTIIAMATVYGTEVGIGAGSLIAAILLVQFVGVPCSFLFGACAARFGSKPMLYAALAVYSAIALLAYAMRTAAHFFALALLVALVQGGSQALSRSLFARLIPADQSGKFFGFFAVVDKAAGVVGPTLFAVVVAATGSSRTATLLIGSSFLVGALLLRSVDVEQGQRLARTAEGAARSSEDQAAEDERTPGT